MRGSWVKYVVPLAFLMHGLGMAGGVWFVFTTKSWFSSLFGPAEKLAVVLAGVLWVVSGVAFVGGAWGLYSGAAWWRLWAAVAAPVSLVGIILWAGKIPPGTYVGAALDIVVIAYLLFWK